MPIHTSCRSCDVVFTVMLFGCISDLKGIYNKCKNKTANINVKNCSLYIHKLTASDTSKTAKITER